ncbi:cytochrome P450 [Gaertneriomyces semiglobifer]|nr:cytochrome P450 [Gaertneriomyces semiglobifer]
MAILALLSTFSAATYVVAAVLFYGIYKVLIHPFLISPLRNVPGPSCNPFTLMGNLKTIIKEEAVKPQLEWTKKYGPIVRYYGSLNRPRILVTDPKVVMAVVNHQNGVFGKEGMNTSTLQKLLGVGLLTVVNDVHKRQRKLLTPVFAPRHIATLTPLFMRSAQELCAKWEKELEDSGDKRVTLDIHEEMSRASLDIIGRAGFGYDFNAVSKNDSKLFKVYNTMMGQLGSSMITILEYYLPWIRRLPTQRNKEWNEGHQVITETCRGLVDDGRKFLSATDTKTEDADIKNNLLNILLKENETSPDKMSAEELEGQVMTFLAAGHETSSVALSWTIHLLATHPEFQEKLRQEIHTRQSNGEDLWGGDYMSAVVKESLRLIPPAPITSRTVLKDTNILGYSVPKGTLIILSPGVQHQVHFPNGDQFIPDRWLSEKGYTPTPGTYLPFLAGPHNCIGQKMALAEIKVVLGMVLAKYRYIDIGRKVERRLGITWKPANGVIVDIERV